MTDSATEFAPALAYLKTGDGGDPWLAGSRCGTCGATVPGERAACPSCSARTGIEHIRLSDRGTLYNFTIVHRSYPGVKTPFVSAIVDLDGGGSIKGTLLDVEPDVSKLPRDMPVRVVFRDSGQVGADGRPFLCYYFVPESGAAA